MNKRQENLENMDAEELREYIYELNESESVKLGLSWDREREPEKIVEQCGEMVPVLEEVPERDIVRDPAFQNDLLIQGDNFHSLSVLTYTHSEKIDLIYIDPPYNTGNDNFVYNDHFVDADDGFRHSKWLNFMEKRLRLARDLLKEDGCILISINENELFVLKLLCDRIFKEKNYLTTFSVKVRHEDRILKGDKDFHEVTEFLLFYRKSDKFRVSKRKEDNSSIEKYVYRVQELTDAPEEERMGSKTVYKFRPDQYKIIKGKPSADALSVTNIRGSLKEGNSSGRFFMAYLNERFESEAGFLYKVMDMGADGLGYRYFTIPEQGKNRKNGDYYQGLPVNRSAVKEFPYPNFLDFEVDFNNVAREGGVEFRNGKKPVEFLKFLFTMGGLEDKTEAVVLDFFAGSGSTGQALLEFNREHGGNRKFILCTNNEISKQTEKNFRKEKSLSKKQFDGMKEKKDPAWLDYAEENGICSSVTWPRMQNVLQGYDGYEPLEGNLLYYRTNFVGLSGSRDQLYYDLTEKCIPMLCVKEGTHVLKEATEEFRIYTDGEEKGYTCVYFDVFGMDYDLFVERLEQLQGPKALYIFALGDQVDERELMDVEDYRIEPIPYRILELYKKVVRLSKE